MKLISIIVSLITTGLAQTKAPYIAFSPQGAQVLKARTGKVIPGVQLLAVIVCHTVIDGGDVYGYAAQEGFPFITSDNSAPLLLYTVNHEALKFWIEAAGLASEGAALIISSGIVSAGAKAIFSAVAGHGVADKAVENLRGRLPDIVGLTASLVDPAKPIGGEGCTPGNILARYGKGIPTTSRRVDLSVVPARSIIPSTSFMPVVPKHALTQVNYDFRFDQTACEYSNSKMACIGF